jgi:hypothetical protein
VNSKWFNINFIRGMKKEIILLRGRYSKAKFLTMGDFNLRIEERQVELPHLFGVWENSNAESCNCANKRNSKDNS